MRKNNFVEYLNRYTTVSSDHEAAFDEFIIQAEPPGKPLRLDTNTERFVREHFEDRTPPSIILTGNAGDGKTYLARQIIEAFTGRTISDWHDRVEYRISKEGHTLRVVKDLSEMSEADGRALLGDLAGAFMGVHSGETFLMAANEGRLRALLSGSGFGALREEVNRQLGAGPELESERLIVLNLNRVTTSTYVSQVLAWITTPEHWDGCEGCPAREGCHMRFNAGRLADPRVASRLKQLYVVLEQLGLHVTIRDMLIHLAYTVTAGKSCDDVHHARNNPDWEPHRYVYYANVWGEAADEVFRRKAGVIHHLRRLNTGTNSVYAVDDFIVNGRPDDPEAQAERERLFAPALDLGGRIFEQERRNYLYGGASSPEREDEHPLMGWLPHCRRKVYFEWSNEGQVNKLFPFLYLPEYLQLTGGEQALLERYTQELILGLNRAFTGLFLTRRDRLYLTSQYARSVEQPVPIIKLEMGSDHVELQVDTPAARAFDNDLVTLRIEVYPPPRVRAKPVGWHIDLLRFEYLMRRARGGTANVLDEECELAVRQLKDELLASFVRETEVEKRISFFGEGRHGYTRRSLWIDENGRIRASG